MLTAFQCEIVAFYRKDVGFICRDCAIKYTSQLTVEKAEQGLTPGRLEPVIRYTLDEYIGENAAEWADEVAGSYPLSGNSDAWQAAYDSYPNFYFCDDCGTEIS